MKILVLGGTRFFGIHMVNELLINGHEVTIATRGKVQDSFGDKVNRIIFDRTNVSSMKEMFADAYYDVVIDKIAYSSDDIKSAMETINCGKYIYTSSTAIYQPKHMNTKEEDFDGTAGKLIWCSRADFDYAEIKRHAEYALWQEYSDRNWVAVRYPFVIGKDDYTKRLLFYVEHVIKSIPMHIDNIDCQMGYIRSDEAGKFMAFLVEKDFLGAVNGCSSGTISLREIIAYVENKTRTKAIIDNLGENAPYNGEPEYSINIQKAQSLGFPFSSLNDWIYDLLDYYIEFTSRITN
ncbi:MAG: NAD-dependent epimerase/dehydratase family protein [Lachnospiraceae bacterium]|nr:NAD-dependent epimerase/dehydratase family protein [Lachnospiraceae bacterium]